MSLAQRVELLKRLKVLKDSPPLRFGVEGGGIPDRIEITNALAVVMDIRLLDEIIEALGG